MPVESPIIEKMQSRVMQWELDGNAQSVFLSCYQMMTANMIAAIDRDEFQDTAWVSRLMNRFAEYYFVALEAYEREPQAASQVWQLAHNKTQDKNTLPIQNLLLGVSAHINYDLVFTLFDSLTNEWADHSDAQRQARYADHCYVNDVIASTIDAVQDQVLELEQPSLDLVDKLFGRVDEFLISLVIKDWRETVWRNASLLLEANSESDFNKIVRQVEHDALKTGRLICLS